MGLCTIKQNMITWDSSHHLCTQKSQAVKIIGVYIQNKERVGTTCEECAEYGTK